MVWRHQSGQFECELISGSCWLLVADQSRLIASFKEDERWGVLYAYPAREGCTHVKAIDSRSPVIMDVSNKYAMALFGS